MVATVVLVAVLDGRVHPAWIPFGAIAAGYALSGIVALFLTTPLMGIYQGLIERPEWVELSRVGRWLLLANLAAFGSDFVLVLIAKAALGPDVLGYAEAARVVARPVIVLGLGLAAVLGPRSVQAGMGPDPRAARSPRRVLWLFSCLGGLLYLPLVGLDWTLNPLPSILPNAYAVQGLVAVTIVGAIIFNFGLPWWYELLGARRQRELARTEMVASILKVTTGLAASLFQAFTLPVAWGIAFTARGIGLDFYVRRLFNAGSPGPTVAQGPESRARGDG
jgi:O-antigen/teichoic acid export membrane protein